jgi:hypothetical protein
MYKLFSLVLLVVLISCGKPLPELEGIDADTWKADKNACLHKRQSMADALEQQQAKLLALDEKQLIRLLGPPDKNELYTRNQKFYTYYITPGPECETADTSPRMLIVRFNAMGLAKEITWE